MGKNINSVVTKGFSGAIGDDIVFRQTKGDQVVAKLPVKSKKPNLIREKFVFEFRKAILYAISVMRNPELKKQYERIAKGVQSAYNLALRDARKAPVVAEINTSQYKGVVGNLIPITALDDFKVTSVRVAIYGANGVLIEEGNAIFPELSMYWIYTVTAVNAQLVGSKIEVTAVDLPGNETTAEVILD
ncbi:MAG: hypothetical protein J7497_10070 [Chitinophagaceae bacterium]|nr:hypothetical protein [Chitinophagaceae bacterium]